MPSQPETNRISHKSEKTLEITADEIYRGSVRAVVALAFQS